MALCALLNEEIKKLILVVFLTKFIQKLGSAPWLNERISDNH